MAGRLDYPSDTSQGLLIRLRGDYLLADGFE